MITAKYRIQNSDGTIYLAGTGENSWFTLSEACELVNYDQGQRIIESNGVDILWEVL